MIFSSFDFIFFFAIVFALILLTQSQLFTKKLSKETVLKVRHIILLISSYIFYGWWDWRFCFLMAALTFIAYISANRISSNKNTLLFKIIGIAMPLLVLCIFKYFNFFLLQFETIFGISNMATLNIILPVGISFYTFQSMSYTLDVLKGRLKPTSLLNLSLYISFFPQLVAGPIVKANEFIPQLAENKLITLQGVERGVQIFLFGLFKKIVIADRLAVFVDNVFAVPNAFHAATIVLAIISYSIQIYFDFSGYSDMAIGIANCFGYNFIRNFNMPYIARNISEFWKRWHISLSSFLQQYLYISLGGNRKGKYRTYINLMITMILGGFWHGANWTFIVWGLIHGVALCIHKAFQKTFTKNKPNAIKTLFSVLLTYTTVCFGWVFFRTETIGKAFVILRRIATGAGGMIQPYAWSFVAIAILIIATLVAVIRNNSKREDINSEKIISGFYPVLNLSKISSLAIVLFFLGLILCLAHTGGNPFLYFQF